MPSDQGFSANKPWPQIDVASSAPMRSASAINDSSAADSTAPRPARMSGRCARVTASASRRTSSGSGCKRPGAGRQFERCVAAVEFGVLHIERQTQHNGLPVMQSARHRAQQIAAGGLRRVDALGNGANRAHKVSLLDIEIRFDVAGRHVSCQDQKRRPAFRGFADPGDGIGQAGPGMHAHERQLSGRLGISVGHAGGIAFVPGGNEFDAGFHQRVRNLEIGRAEQPEATARTERREILRQNCRNCGVIAQVHSSPSFDSLTCS